MNAIIALCHFCEAHGPCAIFCTQTLRETKLEELLLNQRGLSTQICTACNSLGNANALYSKDNDSGMTFLSAQVPVLPEVATLVKEAATQSLCCEISCNKDGGFVFFGDSYRGHVLSHTFHVADLQARGFYQLFSVIVLMKDKNFLLNTKPFVAEHLKKISLDIQAFADKIKEREQKCSGRQRRLSGSQALTPRPVIELTGEDNIFPILHSHFSWILLAGSRFLTEHVTFGNLPWLPPQSSGRPPQQRLTYNVSTLPMIEKYNKTLDDPEQEEFFSVRHIKRHMRKEFPAVCFCALSGIKIIVRGDPNRTFHFMMCLKKLLPEKMHNLIRIDAQHQHSISTEYKIISVSNDIAVPIASSLVCRIDFLDEAVADGNEVSVKWPEEMPRKLPDLMQKLLRAVDETRFTDLVLNKHTKVLVEEWKNKVICLNRAKTSNSLAKLKKVLGIQPQDQPIINYWSAHLH